MLPYGSKTLNHHSVNMKDVTAFGIHFYFLLKKSSFHGKPAGDQRS